MVGRKCSSEIKVGELTGKVCKNPTCGKPLVKKWSGKEPLCCDRKCSAQYSHTVRDAESYKKCWQTYVNKLTAMEVPEEWRHQ